MKNKEQFKLLKQLAKEAYNSKEVWLSVYNYDGFYEVSNLGRVRSLDRDVTHSRSETYTRTVTGRVLSLSKNPQGYFKVRLSKEGKYKTKLVHHLVAESFLGHIKKSHYVCIDHIDENKENNKLSNLQIISKQENTKKSFDNKLNKFKQGDYWYHNNGTLLLIIEVTKTHGGTLKCLPIYTCLSENKFSFHKIGVLNRKATEKEVKKALIKEAERRGFKEGVECYSLLHNKNLKCHNTLNNTEYIAGNYDKLHFGLHGDLYVVIYEKGKWAEIIQDPKEIEVEHEEVKPNILELNGKKYKLIPVE